MLGRVRSELKEKVLKQISWVTFSTPGIIASLGFMPCIFFSLILHLAPIKAEEEEEEGIDGIFLCKTMCKFVHIFFFPY